MSSELAAPAPAPPAVDPSLVRLVQPYLYRDERVLWTGVPGPLRWRDVADWKILVTLVACAAIAVLVFLISSGRLAGARFHIRFGLPVPFVFLGLGKIWELIGRPGRVYALTDRRVLVLNGARRYPRPERLNALAFHNMAYVGASTGDIEIGCSVAALPEDKDEPGRKSLRLYNIPRATAVRERIEAARLHAVAPPDAPLPGPVVRPP